jgi:hypothetical protein
MRKFDLGIKRLFGATDKSKPGDPAPEQMSTPKAPIQPREIPWFQRSDEGGPQRQKELYGILGELAQSMDIAMHSGKEKIEALTAAFNNKLEQLGETTVTYDIVTAGLVLLNEASHRAEPTQE